MPYVPANSDPSDSSLGFVLGDVSPSRDLTIVGAGASIKGSVSASGEISVSGAIDGEVTSNSRVTIEPSGVVKGVVAADEVVVEGLVEGDITARRSVTLAADCEVRGDISTPTLKTHPAATFVGRCFMPPSQNA